MDHAKKVLIITYYWPPSGGAGVQRWLKFAKYLPEFGYTPIIYTPENPEYPVLDPNLEKDIHPSCIVIKQPIWEPYVWYKRLMGMKKTDKIPAGFISEKKKNPFLQKLSIWVRGNILIPDPRVFWVNPSVKFLNDYIKKEQIKTIISTGPPHSMHLIALKIKRLQPNIHWISDFRDPWSNIDFYKELMLTTWADKKHRRLEKEVLQEADVVLTVGETMAIELKQLGAKHVLSIPNGYDEEDVIKNINSNEHPYFNLIYVGSLPKSRNHFSLWKAIKELNEDNPLFKRRIRLTLVGQKDISILNALKEFDLLDCSNLIDYVSHQEAIRYQNEATVLLLLSNNTPNAKGILTGKFFEYLASEKPILAIGDTSGEMNSILKETEAGIMCGFDATQEIKSVLIKWFDLFEKGELKNTSKNHQKYSRKNLTKELAFIIRNKVIVTNR